MLKRKIVIAVLLILIAGLFAASWFTRAFTRQGLQNFGQSSQGAFGWVVNGSNPWQDALSFGLMGSAEKAATPWLPIKGDMQLTYWPLHVAGEGQVEVRDTSIPLHLSAGVKQACIQADPDFTGAPWLLMKGISLSGQWLVNTCQPYNPQLIPQVSLNLEQGALDLGAAVTTSHVELTDSQVTLRSDQLGLHVGTATLTLPRIPPLSFTDLQAQLTPADAEFWNESAGNIDTDLSGDIGWTGMSTHVQAHAQWRVAHQGGATLKVTQAVFSGGNLPGLSGEAELGFSAAKQLTAGKVHLSNPPPMIRLLLTGTMAGKGDLEGVFKEGEWSWQ
ncbi:hypothetical protein ACKC9G_05950 [Pokkaliibacter sp. CJK22405]|uniref:hypothetical protein n=1 Tax=Pokkaliibacter sp. CJK22405 TaxID=3384615 RepID=UPI00398485FB